MPCYLTSAKTILGGFAEPIKGATDGETALPTLVVWANGDEKFLEWMQDENREMFRLSIEGDNELAVVTQSEAVRYGLPYSGEHKQMFQDFIENGGYWTLLEQGLTEDEKPFSRVTIVLQEIKDKAIHVSFVVDAVLDWWVVQAGDMTPDSQTPEA